MGVFDPLLNGLWHALKLGRKHLKHQPTDPNKFKAELGEFIIFNVSARDPNFLQGGIQGAQQQGDGSFWQHTGGGIRVAGGGYMTIEAFDRGIDYGDLDDYLSDKFQLEAFSFPFDLEKKRAVWGSARNLVGKKYDVAEIVCDVLPAELAELFDDKNNFVCSSLWATIMQRQGWPITRKGVAVLRATPGDVHDGCYPQRRLAYAAFGFAHQLNPGL